MALKLVHIDYRPSYLLPEDESEKMTVGLDKKNKIKKMVTGTESKESELMLIRYFSESFARKIQRVVDKLYA